ncbi:MAG TPA: peptidoglycan-binding protein, partial [Candidatus Tenderia electrophaga]|nr:peptidoglycan-binding protein [Candidatus Tenderia electrophaga]
SNKAEVVVGDRKVSLYVDVLKRVQSRLATAGFYNGKIDADYGQASIDAMKGFQRSIDFKATGFPDQMTLWRLFRQAD